MSKIKQNFNLFFAWMVSIAATGGSLYFSEIKHFIPCTLCWYQRIFMYPLVLILAVGFFRKDRNVIYFALPLSIVGGAISTYHYLLQKTSLFDKVNTCTYGIPCKGEYINWFGFVTIPFLALVAFAMITMVLLSILKKNEK